METRRGGCLRGALCFDVSGPSRADWNREAPDAVSFDEAAT